MPGTNRIDLSQPDERTGIADHILDECRIRPGQLVFLDNIVHPSALAGWVSWSDTCGFMEQIRAGLSPAGKRLIANIAVAPWGLTDEDVQLVSDAVDGMAFEMPFHKDARGHRERTQRLFTVYRHWLNAGKFVVLIPLAPLETRHQEAEFIAGFAMLFRNYGDRLHVAWPFFQVAPEWTYWPREFGPPETDVVFEGSILRRDFQNLTLYVDPGTTTVSIRPRL